MAGDYAAAARVATTLVEQVPSDAGYRLLAIAEARQGHSGEAVWALRSATALGAPTAGVKIVEEVYAPLPLDLHPLPHRGITAFVAVITRSLAPQLPSALALLAAAVAALLATVRLVRPDRQAARASSISVAVALCVSGASLWLAFRQNALARPAEAVVLAEAVLRRAPAEDAPASRTLPAGAVVATGEELGGFVAAELPNGQEGWIAIGSIRRVAPLGSD